MGSQQHPIKKSATIEVPITNLSASQFQFTDNETTLDNIRVVGMVVHTANVAKTFNGKTVVPDAIQKKAFITLNDKNSRQHLKRLPLETFFLNAQLFREELAKLDVDVRKSFIEINDKTGLTTDMAFLVTFFYEEAAAQ